MNDVMMNVAIEIITSCTLCRREVTYHITCDRFSYMINYFSIEL